MFEENLIKKCQKLIFSEIQIPKEVKKSVLEGNYTLPYLSARSAEGKFGLKKTRFYGCREEEEGGGGGLGGRGFWGPPSSLLLTVFRFMHNPGDHPLTPRLRVGPQ